MEQDVVITGIGAISAYGPGLQALLQGVRERRSAIGDLTLFEPPAGYERAAEAPDFDPAGALFSTQPYLDRTTALAVVAAREALDAAGLVLPVAEDADAPVGLCFGSAWGCMESVLRFSEPLLAGKPKTAQGLVFTHSFPNSPASVIAIEFGLRGYATVAAGGRLAGLRALEEGAAAIAEGTAQCVLVGAAESLSEPVFAHRAAAGEFTSGAPRPLQADADGTLPGEAAVFFVLEHRAHARRREARILSHLCCCDLHVPDTPPPVEHRTGMVYACAPGIPAVDARERAVLDRVGIQSAPSLVPLHGDALSVNPLLALAVGIGRGEAATSVIQASEDGEGMARAAHRLADAVCTKDALERAREQRNQSGRPLADILIEMGYLTKADLQNGTLRALEELDVISDLDGRTIPASVIERVPPLLAHVHRVVPVAYADGVLTVAMTGPPNPHAIEDVANLLDCRVRVVLAPPDQIARALERHYPDGPGPWRGAPDFQE